MDADVLERLMLDHSLGALGGDVECLLAEYLKDHPAAAAAAAEFGRAVTLARAAMSAGRQEQPAAALPPLRRAAGPASRRWPAVVAAIGSAAAGVAIGLAIGLAAMRQTAPAGGSPGVAVGSRPPATPAARAVRVPAAAAEFWSRRDWLTRLSAAGPADGLRVKWTSPVQAPRLGDGT